MLGPAASVSQKTLTDRTFVSALLSFLQDVSACLSRSTDGRGMRGGTGPSAPGRLGAEKKLGRSLTDALA